MTTRQKSIVGLGVLSALGFLVAGWSIARIYDVKKNWRTVTGRVVTLDVVPKKAAPPSLAISYEYSVGGQKYRSNAWNRSLWESDLKSTLYGQLVEAQWLFRPGKSVTVYHSPTDPAVSVLETRGSDSGLALVIALSAAFGAVVVHRRGRNKPVAAG